MASNDNSTPSMGLESLKPLDPEEASVTEQPEESSPTREKSPNSETEVENTNDNSTPNMGLESLKPLDPEEADKTEDPEAKIPTSEKSATSETEAENTDDKLSDVCDESNSDFSGFDISLETLPRELLLHIFSFIDAKFVIRTLSSVCRYLNSVINDTVFWKARIGKHLKKKYPAIPVSENDFNWMEACIAIEEQHRLWTNNAAQMDYFKYKEGIFASVDSVHLMQNGRFLAAGSRDRYLNILDIDRLDPDSPNSFKDAKVMTKMNAHKGWIWSMSSLDNMLATGSWDTKIKFWDVAAEGQVVREMSAKSAVLCTHYEPNFFVAGAYDKKVYHFDPRTSTVITTKRYHKRPVLSLVVNDMYIITGSEDKSLVVYDRRADAVIKTLEMADYPMCLWYGQDQLWVGDKLGLVHLIDATDGDFNIVQTYDVGHKGKVSGIVQTPGALFTCSTDKTVKVLEPCLSVDQPTVLATLTPHTAEIASITFENDTLACASSDCSVGIWKPKHQVNATN